MKKIVFGSVVLLSLFIVSCAPDKKDDPTSPSNPTTDTRDKFVAYWNVNEHSTLLGGNSTHTVNIVKSGTLESDIIIYNFYGVTSSAVRATVSNNSFTIPYQSIQGGYVKGGSGSLSGSTTINLNYTVALTSQDTCTAVYTKQ